MNDAEPYNDADNVPETIADHNTNVDLRGLTIFTLTYHPFRYRGWIRHCKMFAKSTIVYAIIELCVINYLCIEHCLCFEYHMSEYEPDVSVY